MMSVRVRLTFAVTLIFAVALTLAAVGLVRQVETALVDDVQARNDTVAQAIGKIVAGGDASALALADPTQFASGLDDSYDPDVLRETLNDSLIYVRGPGSAQVAPATNLFDRIRHAISGEAVPLFRKAMPSRIDDTEYVVSSVKIRTVQGNVVLSVASSLE